MELPKTRSEWLNHLALREGFKDHVYLDSLGKPTAGTGHLLTPDEIQKFPKGVTIHPAILKNWLEKDSEKAFKAAQHQCELLDIPKDNPFVYALASVCFQLGTLWYTIHIRTWNHLKTRNFEGVIKEVENSTWFKQTPVRVKDFQAAIVVLKETLWT